MRKPLEIFVESNYIGRRFNRLVFLCDLGVKRGLRYVWVQCDCGNKKRVILNNLKTGRTQSCGCYAAHNIPPYIRTTHNSMIGRCYYPSVDHYKYYGGRGISVCDDWRKSLGIFYQNMGDRQTSKHSLDRIDNNGNYEPSNCRWATRLQQGRNKSTTNLLTPVNVGKKTNFSREYIRQLAENGSLNRFIKSKELINTNKRFIFYPSVIDFLKYHLPKQRKHEKTAGIGSTYHHWRIK